MNDEHIKKAFFTIDNHLLELWAFVCGGAFGAVDIDFNEFKAFLFAVGFNGSNLSVNGFIPLVVTGEASVSCGALNGH
ncbi:hypothetical protein D1872_318980 [compost metagenome]